MLQWGFAQYQLRHWLTKASFDPGFYREIFQYSLPLGLASIVGMLSVQLDKLVISGFFSPAQYAVFSIGAMELPFISILNNSVNAILLPHISSEPAKLAETYRASVRKNAIIIFPFAALGLIFAKPLITLLYTETYLASVPFFQVYLLNLPLRVATYGIIFMALGKTRYIMLNSLITLGLNLALNLILVNLMGMMGAVIATVTVTWLSVGIYLYWIRRVLRFDLAELFPLKALFKTALVVIFATLIAYSVFWILGDAWILQFIALAVFLGVYLGLGKLLNVILPYDIEYVKKLLSQFKTRFIKAR